MIELTCGWPLTEGGLEMVAAQENLALQIVEAACLEIEGLAGVQADPAMVMNSSRLEKVVMKVLQ